MMGQKNHPEDHQLASQCLPRDRFFYPIITQIVSEHNAKLHLPPTDIWPVYGSAGRIKYASLVPPTIEWCHDQDLSNMTDVWI